MFIRPHYLDIFILANSPESHPITWGLLCLWSSISIAPRQAIADKFGAHQLICLVQKNIRGIVHGVVSLQIDTHFNTLRPRQNGSHFRRHHFQMHFLLWKLVYFCSNFPEICQHWCRWWLGAEQVTKHYLNLGWPSLPLMHICVT